MSEEAQPLGLQISILIIGMVSTVLTSLFGMVHMYIEYKKNKTKKDFQQKHNIIANTINEVHQHIRRISTSPMFSSSESIAGDTLKIKSTPKQEHLERVDTPSEV